MKKNVASQAIGAQMVTARSPAAAATRANPCAIACASRRMSRHQQKHDTRQKIQRADKERASRTHREVGGALRVQARELGRVARANGGVLRGSGGHGGIHRLGLRGMRKKRVVSAGLPWAQSTISAPALPACPAQRSWTPAWSRPGRMGRPPARTMVENFASEEAQKHRYCRSVP